MSDSTFSLVTAIFTLGGLAASLGANIVMDKRGRKAAVKFSGFMNFLGSALMTVGSGVNVMLVGR